MEDRSSVGNLLQCVCQPWIDDLVSGLSSPMHKSWHWWRSLKWKGRPTESRLQCLCSSGHRPVTTNPTHIRIHIQHRGLRPHKSE